MKSEKLTQTELAGMFDHTLLKAYASKEDFNRLCHEAMEYGFAMVAINSAQVKYCKKLLENTDVHVGAAISFPLGQTTIEMKIAETKMAIDDGADEIDYVINIGEVKNRNYNYIKNEMEQIIAICKHKNVISKVIFENCYLTKDEINKVAQIASEVRPDFIKTSTGFGSSGSKVEDVMLMKQVVGEKVKIKAAGGIRDWETCRALIDAGAERIGTSRSIEILQEFSII